MNTIRTEVRLFAESGDFDPDRLNYMDCPECGGAKKCMVVPAENGRGYYFKCFRDSCGVSGVTGGGLGRHMSTAKPRRRTYPKPGPGYVCRMGHDGLERFKRLYGLSAGQTEHLCVGYDPRDNSFIFPIRGPVGLERGYVSRYFDNRSTKKALVRPYEEDGPLTAWYRPHNVSVYNAPLVLVEDQISAARVAGYVPCVALLGTNLTLDAQAELIGWCKSHRDCPVIVSLDRDATETGIHMTTDLHGLPGVWAYHVPLPGADIKDMLPTEYADYVAQLRHIMLRHTERLRTTDGN